MTNRRGLALWQKLSRDRILLLKRRVADHLELSTNVVSGKKLFRDKSATMIPSSFEALRWVCHASVMFTYPKRSDSLAFPLMSVRNPKASRSSWTLDRQYDCALSRTLNWGRWCMHCSSVRYNSFTIDITTREKRTLSSLS